MLRRKRKGLNGRLSSVIAKRFITARKREIVRSLPALLASLILTLSSCPSLDLKIDLQINRLLLKSRLLREDGRLKVSDNEMLNDQWHPFLPILTIAIHGMLKPPDLTLPPNQAHLYHERRFYHTQGEMARCTEGQYSCTVPTAEYTIGTHKHSPSYPNLRKKNIVETSMGGKNFSLLFWAFLRSVNRL